MEGWPEEEEEEEEEWGGGKAGRGYEATLLPPKVPPEKDIRCCDGLVVCVCTCVSIVRELRDRMRRDADMMMHDMV